MVFVIGTKKEFELQEGYKIKECMFCKNEIDSDDAIIITQSFIGMKETPSIMHAKCLIIQIKRKDPKFFQKMIAEEI